MLKPFHETILKLDFHPIGCRERLKELNDEIERTKAEEKRCRTRLLHYYVI